nr:class F sortase [uncultured Friedmanniella sp.]
MTPHRTAMTAWLLLLPLVGCAGEAAPAAPPPAAAPSAVPSVAAATPAPRPARAAQAAPPSVPTVRATLQPAARAKPAPARFAADRVGINLPVRAYGVDDQGLMRLPETVHEVAWYEFSAPPGQSRGTTVLAAHVDTVADGLGPFAKLRDLRRGNELTVTDAAGKLRRYTVTAVEKVDKSEVPLDRVFRREGDAELKVITCGGSFNRRDGYSDNVIVTARPAS